MPMGVVSHMRVNVGLKPQTVPIGVLISSGFLSVIGGELGFHCPAEGGTVLSLRLPIAAERLPAVALAVQDYQIAES